MSWGLTLSMLLAAIDGKPIGDDGKWLTSDDYPKSEIARGVVGVSAFALTVDKNGSVDDCNVVKSSGSDALDATGCALLKVRAHFTPAHDGHGSKVPFIYHLVVRWQVPKDIVVPLPTQPDVLTVQIDQDEKGVVEDCTVLARPKALSQAAATPCINFPVGLQLRRMGDPNGKAVKIRMTLTETMSYAIR